MEKKIIALALVLVLMVTCFVGCKKGEVYVDEDGIEHRLYLDEEGSTVLDDKGNMVIYAIDDKGRIVKDENGEPVTAAVAFPEKVVKGNTFETPDYKMTMPEDWVLSNNGTYTKKDNENITLKITKLGEIEAKTIDEYLANSKEDNDEVEKVLKEKYPACEIKYGKTQITMKNLDCMTIDVKLAKEENGPIDWYTYSICFISNEKLFKVDLIFVDNSYDETIKEDVHNIIDANFVLKEYK